MITFIFFSIFTLFSNPLTHFSNPPKLFSNVLMVCCSERVLYSAHTHTLVCIQAFLQPGPRAPVLPAQPPPCQPALPHCSCPHQAHQPPPPSLLAGSLTCHPPGPCEKNAKPPPQKSLPLAAPWSLSLFPRKELLACSTTLAVAAWNEVLANSVMAA